MDSSTSGAIIVPSKGRSSTSRSSSTSSKSSRSSRQSRSSKSSVSKQRPPKLPEPKHKRSKNGCLSCKKLKIKCNEGKPTCEYCRHTNKQCVYPMQTSVKIVKRKSVPEEKSESDSSIEEINNINNRPLQKLNSMSIQLDVSKFELQLLKFYLDFGTEFFTFNINKNAMNFWGNEVPQLWCGSDLVKSSLYAVSSARLLANYKYDVQEDIHIECEDEHSKLKKRINLSQEVSKYITKTEELMDLYIMALTPDSHDLVDIVGQMYIAKKAISGAKVIVPRPVTLDQFGIPQIGDLQLIQLMKDTSKFFKFIHPLECKLENTKYEQVRDLEMVVNTNEMSQRSGKLLFINHLRNYVRTHIDLLDLSYLVYLDAISKVELGCLKTLVYKSPVTLFKCIVELCTDRDFLQLVLKKEQLALKILYYASVLNFIFHYKLFQKNMMHDEFMNFYERHSNLVFGGWEEDIDKNFHDVSQARIRSLLPYDFNLINHLGKPVEQFLNGELGLVSVDNSNSNVFF